MSATVDSRVVEMKFDNKQFEDGVATTISTLEKLKQKLNLSGATKGMEEVNAAANRVNLTGLVGAAETVGLKFNAMYTIADQALRNITNSAVNAGKRIVSSLTIEPIKTGLSEYETQINAVQTILANTESKGTTLQQVNAALDTLNTYADKTIYNFTEMTRNIGTFTAAGVDLNTSVNAIQGIANLAAVSGSSSQQASTAMYQLSQALSSGTVKLMDWNSVVNAGMGGQVFQDALKETAKVHGINVDKMIKKHGSFRETLQKGWITSDILTETLSHFTMAAEEGSEAWKNYKRSLMDQGYSEKQAEAILKMSNTATDAATKVKTATQLYDTLKETAQSGWTQTWEIIMGDFGEAKKLFSGIYETLSPIIEATSEARNKLLSGGLSSGWKQLLGEGIADEQGYVDAIKDVAKHRGIAIEDMIKAEQELDSSLSESEAFQKALSKGLNDGTISAGLLSESVEWLANDMTSMSDKELEAAGYTKEHIEQIRELDKKLKDGSISMEEFVEKMKRPSGRENLIDSLYNSFKAVMSIITPIKQAFSEIFPALQPEQLYKFTETLKNFTAKLTLSDKASENLKRTFKGLFAILDIAKTIFGAVIKAISPLFGKVDDLGGGILGVTAKIGDWLVSLSESIKTSGFLTKAVDKIHKAFEKVKNFLQPVIEGFKKFGNEVTKNLTAVADNAETRLGPLTALGKFIMAVFTGIGNVVKKVFPYVSAAASAIGKVLGDLMGRISDSIQNADYDAFFDLTSGGIIAAIGVFIAKFMKSGADLVDNAGGFLEAIKEIPENISNILGGVGDALGAFTDSLKADTLKKIATAIGILAVSLLVLSLIPSEKLTTALLTITTLFGELMGSMAIFSKMGDMKGIAKTAGALVALASAMLILSIALKIMSTMSWSEMGVGLVTMTVGLGELVGAVALLSLMPEKELKSSVKAIKGLASALVVLAVALKIMGSMSWAEMGVALVSMTAGLGALVLAVNLLPNDTAKRAAGLVGLAVAMVILGAALKIMATMSWEELAISLVALAGSLAILAGAMHLMKSALPGAIAMMLVAPALVILAGAMKILSGLSWEEVARGLVAIGGSLLIIAGAMYLMSSAIPGALALIVVSAALAVLTPVLMALGSMSLAEIGKALLVLAGVFVVLGVAALVLTPVIPAILALAGAVALLGVACVAIGAGVLMIGAGLTILAAALAASGGAITVFVASIISLIPFLIEQIGLGIIKLCQVIAGSAAAICEAVAVIIIAVVDALVEAVPHLVEGLLVLITSLLDSLIEHLPTIVAQLATLIVSLLTLLTEHTPAIVEALFVFIGTVIQAISDNITRIVEPLVSLITAIVQGIVDVIGPVIQDVIAPLVQLLTDILSGIAIVITSVAMAISVALNGLANIFDSIFNGIATVIESVGNSIKSILEGIADTVESVGQAIKDSLDGLSGVFDSAFGGIADVIDSVGDGIKKFLDGIAGVIDSVGEAALNAGTGFENLAKGIKIITELKLVDMIASLAAVAGGVGDIAAHSGGIQKVGSGMSAICGSAGKAASGFSAVNASISVMATKLEAIPRVMTNMVMACTSVANKMTKVGKDLLTKLIDGIDSQKKNAKTACTTLVSDCADVISDKSRAFKTAARDLVRGFANGISVNTYLATAKSRAMAKAAADAAKEELDEHSPSKVGYGIGDFFGIAFVNGIADNIKSAYKTSTNLATSAREGISNAINKISAAISGDMDTQPTIRPVIDLSGVRSGVGAISGMLNMDSAVGVRANISAISSMMSGRGQNGSNVDIVSAINKLNKKMDNIGNTTYQVNGITYDDGSNISTAVADLVRAARIERRV